MSKHNVIGIALLFLAACIWGGLFVVVKGVVNIIPPAELVWFRYLIAVIALLLYAWPKHLHWRWNAKQVLLCAIVGILGYNIALITQETGTKLANAQTGAVVTTAMPIFTIVLSWIFLHDRLGWRRLVAVLLAVVGVLIIMGNNAMHGGSLIGIAMFLISSFSWASAEIVLVKLSGFYNDLQATIISMITSLVLLTPWTISHWRVLSGVNFLSPKIIFSLLFIGCISTALAYLCWNQGIFMMGADTAGIVYLCQPIVGTLLGWLVLGEQITLGFIVGTAIIIGSVIMYLRARQVSR